MADAMRNSNIIMGLIPSESSSVSARGPNEQSQFKSNSFVPVTNLASFHHKVSEGNNINARGGQMEYKTINRQYQHWINPVPVKMASFM